MAGIGALGPQVPTGVPTAAQVGATAPIGLPNLGSTQKQENLGYAAGGLYDAYRDAQQNELDRQNKLISAGRDRLKQIWELGVQNPQIQNDPRVQHQVVSIYKQMGLDAPVQNGKLDWAQLQPVQALSDVKGADAVMKQAMALPPEKRPGFFRSMGIVGVPPEVMTAPREWSAAELTNLDKEYTAMFKNGGVGTMTVDQVNDWITHHQDGLKQLLGVTNPQDLLEDPRILSQMGQATMLKMQNLQKALGLKDAQIAQDMAKAAEAHSSADLKAIQAKYTSEKAQAYPEEIKNKIAGMQAQAANWEATASKSREWITAVQQGKVFHANQSFAELTKARSEAARTYTSLQAQLAAEYRSGLGVDDALVTAVNTAKEEKDRLDAAWTQSQSPDIKKMLQANRTTAVSGTKALPVGVSGNLQPYSKTWQGNPVWTNGKRYYLDPNGQTPIPGQ